MDAGDWEQDLDEDEVDPDESRTAPCPACMGTGQYLGLLARWDWFLCRHCGAEFHA